jgi:hypothetical protein
VELVLPRLRSIPRPNRDSWKAEMEKVVLLCLLIGIITALAELSRAPQARE